MSNWGSEQQLYRELLENVSRAVFWPGDLVRQNTALQTGEVPEKQLEELYLLGADSEDSLQVSDCKMVFDTSYSTEVSGSLEDTDLEIGMALGSMYRDRCYEKELNAFELHEDILQQTAEDVVETTAEMNPETVVYNLESMNSDSFAALLSDELDSRGYRTCYLPQSTEGFDEGHVVGQFI